MPQDADGGAAELPGYGETWGKGRSIYSCLRSSKYTLLYIEKKRDDYVDGNIQSVE